MDALVIIRKVEEIAEENGWRVEKSSEDGINWTFKFFKESPAGQDFSFCAEMEDNSVAILVENIYERYSIYDCSLETYIWLDSTGHGTNGAPYDMKDLYEDMEACQKMMLDLHNALRIGMRKGVFYD